MGDVLARRSTVEGRIRPVEFGSREVAVINLGSGAIVRIGRHILGIHENEPKTEPS